MYRYEILHILDNTVVVEYADNYAEACASWGFKPCNCMLLDSCHISEIKARERK